MLAVQSLTVDYAGQGGQVRALEDFSLTLEGGEFVCLVGPSGCGKSTLLNLIAGILPPTSGEIRIGRADAGGQQRPVRIGFVFQEPTLLPWKTVRENVRFSLSSLKYGDPTTWDDRVDRQIEMIGLNEFANAFPRELSGGMRSRVGVARAMVIDPEVLLMDEPFSHLDELTAASMREDLMDLWNTQAITTLFVTHNVAEATLLGDRVVVLTTRPGRLYREYEVDLGRPRDPFDLDGRLHQLQTEVLRDLMNMAKR